ncbi:MAG: DNA-3-methyladenine glycosylase I [Gemmatimonadota bacterium]|nr:DNA-3-methyladenine glycosylase I [Gemmatimonadota bacterium]MDH3368295.1 DNA-3-methyladenine glycosylase I [Gemmatimonadota bacterium]MDH3478243.1 DNA-3-methyladenine glycosylase I [Gemmatimonadota bacterium]
MARSVDPTRCPWCLVSPVMTAYHDTEWGVPVHDDRLLFEHLVLDSFQAGLSWAVVLNKRDNFRRAFDGFEPAKVARMTGRRVDRLLQDPGIIRNRKKIEATIGNARAYLEIMATRGSFATLLWEYADGAPRQNRRRRLSEIPTRSAASDRMSAGLKAAGFRFVGTTICYAFMQAVGMVNDHLVTCFRWKELGR